MTIFDYLIIHDCFHPTHDISCFNSSKIKFSFQAMLAVIFSCLWRKRRIR